MGSTEPDLHREFAWYSRTAASTCLFQVLYWPLHMFVSHAKFDLGSLVKHIQTTENADRGITINCKWSVSHENACCKLEVSPTIVNTIVPSSHPNWPPQQGNLAIIRKIKAIAATTSPAIPAIDTTLVRSRTGAWHAVWVTFFVAKAN